MTGFGSGANDTFVVEIRSLNHRYLDIFIKMPAYLNQHEIPIRNMVKGKFLRGRFDIVIAVNKEKSSRFSINREMAKNIYSALQTLQRDLLIPGEITMETIAGYKEMLMEEEPDYDVHELMSAVEEAVRSLDAMRSHEGSILGEDLIKRIGYLKGMNERVKSRAPDEVPRLREKFTERLKQVLDAEAIDSNRVLQEAAILADKLDVSEEITRIESHIKQFSEILNTGDVAGKKLDFILQELGREVNTLAYKSADYSISSLVIDMKTEIEKIREQVQNIQ
ncbi:MAG TPA: YicC/YloC family endoribonuclease [Thermodesulfovibrionales bacterium]|nr:YicC/YloC family endoribonuclease [Thermodesulfovibrionales bacterium]